MLRTRSLLVGSGLLAALSAVGCSSDSLTTPGSTTLEITTSTSGSEPDADGYTIQVDGGAAQSIGASASLQRTDLSAGNHSLRLDGMAPNCSVTGDNPRTVNVASGQTTTVTFAVTCVATTGGLQVSATTSGPSPDADGYTVTVDGAEHGTLGASGTVGVDGLAVGDHVVGLSGVAANCQVQGDNPRTVTIPAGAAASTAFTVSCTTPPAGAGTLRVKTATSGADLDPDGYTLRVDGGKTQPIGVNGTAVLANLPGGSHSVSLSGLASNCSVQGSNPRSVSVAAATTVDASFAIRCRATTGTIKVTTTTTGSPVDADGYSVAVDEGPAQSIGVNASLTVASVPARSHRVTLAGLAPGCTVQNVNPRTVTVAVGAETPVGFTITCGTSGNWTTISLPGDLVASYVWASSSSDIFVVARSRTAPSTAGTSVLHYDGHAWTEQLQGVNWYTSPYALWGSSPTDVFAAGNTNVWHYDGTRWQATPRELELYSSIWGSSSHDVFVGGVADLVPENPLVVHYDGTQWSYQGLDFNPGRVYDLAGSSAADVWAVGEQDAPPDAPPELAYQTSEVVHYDGNTWHRSLEIPLKGGPNDIAMNAVWANAPNDVFLVGLSGRVMHYDGASWSPMTSPTSQNLWDIWGNSGSNVYAVGGGGIMHYDGTAWTVINSTDSRQVWGVATDVFVVSSRGEVLHHTP